MLSTGNAIHLTHGDLLGRVDSTSRNVIAACNLPRFPCTSLDNLKIPHHDVLSCFLTSSLGWGFRCQVATRREIYGPVINSRQQEAVVTWWGSNSPAGKATKRASGQHLESPVPTQSPWAGGLGWGWKEKCTVGSGKQLHPFKCYDYNRLLAQIVIAHG